MARSLDRRLGVTHEARHALVFLGNDDTVVAGISRPDLVAAWGATRHASSSPPDPLTLAHVHLASRRRAHGAWPVRPGSGLDGHAAGGGRASSPSLSSGVRDPVSAARRGAASRSRTGEGVGPVVPAAEASARPPPKGPVVVLVRPARPGRAPRLRTENSLRGVPGLRR